ncbi:MAG: succinate dehydrogenase cytochrome b subunit [Saprospiraceae bacterium]|nr:succinate dehydrogenase cytochrome b subunit [Saprospiraceae bacterium]
MIWLFNFLFRSSIGRKVVMSLSGLFLILFLVVHLLGNFQLLADDGGMQFNQYTRFMTHNPLIKTISYILYFTILLHSVQGILLALENRKAKGKSYKVPSNADVSLFSKYMAHLGIIIFIFLLIHMYQFWLQMKLGNVTMVNYPNSEVAYQDLYVMVMATFNNLPFVIFYVISMLILGMHLWHGFQSAFQTLGLNHQKYNPLIRYAGMAYAILVSLGFAVIPIIIYLSQA